MSTVMDTIRQRRSIRAYEANDIPDETLDDILDALRWAQSWANTQCWELVVIKDRAVKEALQQTVPEGNPARDAVVLAPVVLALCGKLESAGYFKGAAPTKFGDWFMFDLGIAAQNIALAAHAHGLGAVIVGMLDHDRARQALNVPEGYELVVLMPLGCPAQRADPPHRRAVSEFTHHDRF